MWHYSIYLGIAAFSLLATSFSSPQPLMSPSVPVSSTAQEPIHVVKAGDDLADLAERYYGNRDYWTSIWNDNPDIIHPDSLKEGMRLTIRTQTPGSVENIIEERMEKLMADTTETLDQELAFAPAIDKTAVAPTQATIAVPAASQGQAPVISHYDDVYQKAGEKYGVPWQVLYGLHLTETGQRDGAIYSGYGSGAQGPMQFMPGTWNAYGVDGNGDGVADINNAEDAIHGAANYLAQHGGVEQGLEYYGGNTSGTLSAACSRGYCQ